ncbi:class I SAM-dependent methyltransferase [Halapricum desulfuricans]|nr:class I SAM-dependent methyltransferase [Halapricum desulfuricans]
MSANVTVRHRCRVCDSHRLYSFLDLGEMPPANAFLDKPSGQESFPLEAVVCEDCDHVQLRHTVDPELLFGEYHYFSSASAPMSEHFDAYADAVDDRYLDTDPFVVEIGSNDGVLLSQFPDRVGVLGVEPAANVAEAARERGVETLVEFFGSDVGARIRDNYGRADAILANNVVGHIDDLHGLMTGVDTLLASQGVFVVEVPYLVDTVANNQFDQIYHEHLSYFSVRSFQRLAEQFDMRVVDVERQSVHGGTIRVHIQRQAAGRSPTRMVRDLETLELALGLDGREAYDEFAHRVDRTRTGITKLFDRLKTGDVTIVGYGATAKGNVLLNYCDIGPETLAYILDTTPAKQGTYSPGMHVPVREPAVFYEDPPEYAVLLAWNYRDAILRNEAEREFRKAGGQFVLPIPAVDII